jgi:hypothetical protein
MSCSTCDDLERSFGGDVSKPEPSPSVEDPSFAGTLKKIVRRILRTQSCRTQFEARVLDEARRLVGDPLRGLAGDALERLIVAHLLGMCREDGLEFAMHGAAAICPATRLRVANSTFRRR